MKSKGILRLLSILVALLLLPFGALAQGAQKDMVAQAYQDGKEVVTTLTFTPGAAMGADQITTDLCAATALRLTSMSDGYGALTLVLSGTDVFSAKLRTETDGMYAESEVLGDKPLYFTWDDLESLITEAMQDSGADADTIASFTQGFTQGIEEMTLLGGQKTEDMTEEEVKQKIIEAMGGDESFVQWIDSIEAKQIVTKGEFTLGDSDVADTKTEMTLTTEDMNAMLDTQYMKDKVSQQIKLEDSTLTDEELAAKTEEAIAEAKAEMEASGFTMPVTVYTVGEDEDFVAMQFDMTGNFTSEDINDGELLSEAGVTIDESDEPFKLDMTVKVIKKTLGTGTLYTLSVTATKDDESTVTMDGNLNVGDTACTGALTILDKDAQPALTLALTSDYTDPKHVTGSLEGTVVADEETTAFMLSMDKVVGDTTADTALSLYTAASLSALKADPDAALLGTLNIGLAVQEPGDTFTALAAATPDTSLEVMKLSDSEMQDYLGTLETNYMAVFYAIFTNLPDSVAQALSSEISN